MVFDVADAPTSGAPAAAFPLWSQGAAMNLDNKLSLDEGSNGRDHRARSSQSQDQVPRTSPGTPTERTVAGGATPVSRAEQRPARNATEHGGDEAKAAEQRRNAERELAQMLRLPADTRLDIAVDTSQDEVRFQIRERRSGKLLREVPPGDAKPLLEKLKEFAGVLVDRSF